MRAGKKFNGKKEYAKGLDYLSIRRFRFRLKCEECKSIITFLTDPKNRDYEMETGASRNFDATREENSDTNKTVVENGPEAEQDSMKLLENRTLDSRREMEMLDRLEEMRQNNRRREQVNVNNLFEPKELEDEMAEEVLAQAAFKGKQNSVKRIDEDEPPPSVIKESPSVIQESKGESNNPAFTIVCKKRKNPHGLLKTKKKKKINMLVSYDSDSN